MWGAVRRGTLGRELVGDTLFRSSGRGGLGHRNRHLGHQRVSWRLPGKRAIRCSPHVRERSPRGSWESQSSPGDRQGSSWKPRALPGRESAGHVGTPGRLRGCTFGSSEHDFRSAGRLGKPKFGFQVPGSARYGRIQQSCAPSFFFRGRRLWPQAISYVHFSRSALLARVKRSLLGNSYSFERI